MPGRSLETTTQPVPVQDAATMMNPRQMDIEFQKHILDINPLELAFYKVFSGWREITTESKRKLYDNERTIKVVSFKIDRYSRCLNEWGASELFTQVVPLVSPGSATSHLKPIEIYNLWNGHLTTIETLLLDAYSIPKYICNTKKCNFISPNPDLVEEHKRLYKHNTFTEVINPYEMDPMKYPNIITFLATLSVITAKAKEGFTLRELAESFLTQQIIRSGGVQVPVEQPGVLRRIAGR
jgi:hypothetical protein